MQFYEGLRIKASGTKYANPQQNDITVTVSGLKRETREFLLEATSPYNQDRSPKRLVLDVGRNSIGLFRLFYGDIVSAEPGPPPDLDLTIKAMTGNAAAGQIISRSSGPVTQLSVIARTVAQDLGLQLLFETADKNISSYSFTGPAAKQVQKLQDAGGVSAFVDDVTLVVKDRGAPVKNRLQILNKDSGMVGIPKATEKGLKVSFLINGETTLGGMLRVQSKLNPSLSGDYIIDQLGFEVSTHDDPFFYNALATRA
jgi:hypothetical protein